MFVVDDAEKRFEFEYKGKAYSVTAPESMPTETMYEYVDKAAEGPQALMRWLFDYFMQETDGGIEGMRFDAFASLTNAWQQNGQAPLGESLASSD